LLLQFRVNATAPGVGHGEPGRSAHRRFPCGYPFDEIPDKGMRIVFPVIFLPVGAQGGIAANHHMAIAILSLYLHRVALVTLLQHRPVLITGNNHEAHILQGGPAAGDFGPKAPARSFMLQASTPSPP